MVHLTPEELTLEKLAQLLDDAAIRSQVDDKDDLYLVKPGVDFPIWVAPDSDGTRIRCFTYLRLEHSISFERTVAYANKANLTFEWCSFAADVDEENIPIFRADLMLNTAYGIDSRTFIATVRAFAGSFAQSVDRRRFEDFFELSLDDDDPDDSQDAVPEPDMRH